MAISSSTEAFGAIPVNEGKRRMERTARHKRRALLCKFPTRDTETGGGSGVSDATSTTTPFQTCWASRQTEDPAIHHLSPCPHHRLHGSQELREEEGIKGDNNSSRNCERTGRLLSICQFRVSHVFRESSLIFLLIFFIFSTHLIQPSSGLHPQCQWSHPDRLNCLVDTLNSFNFEEKVHQAQSLWLTCRSDSTFSGSSGNFNDAPFETERGHHHHHRHHSSSSVGGSGIVLSHALFTAVPNLRDLRIENCKIEGISSGALNYLQRLQNLTIRAHTSPSSSLEITSSVLRGLPDLRYLDLSTTSLTSLPTDLLCFLPSLEYLNLTSCYLRDLTGIIPSDPTNPQNCASSIRVLDLSGNHLTLLPPAAFAGVSKVEELRIDRNTITSASERSLLALTNLRVLRLHENHLTSLPPLFFKDNSQLQEIFLQNNSLSVLAPGVFNGLKNLQILDLSNNELTSQWVNKDTFRGLENLFSLSLAHNSLTSISDMFHNLHFLQMLSLENNEIGHVDLANLPNIYTLLLSHNNIKSISASFCNGLSGLTFLSMDNNKIAHVDPDSFKNCSASLQDVNLSGNKLTEVPLALSALRHLRTLDLGENQIKDVANASWQSLPNLYGLRLTDNQISYVPKDAFKLPLLKILNMAKNNISFVDPGSFESNPFLQAIRLDSNRLSSINGLFNRSWPPNLLFLNLSGNFLEEWSYGAVPHRLQWVDLSNNKIEVLGKCNDVDLRIKNLVMSNNRLKEITADSIPNSIQYITLNNNSIQNILPYTFFRKPNITFIDLRFNELEDLQQDTIRLDPGENTPVAEIFLSHNPFKCCKMTWLKEIGSEENYGKYPIIRDIEDIDCFSSQFLCQYESHCVNSCQCCEIAAACDCRAHCVKGCNCYHDISWTYNLVDCSMLGENFIPDGIPMDATEVRLDGNNIQILQSHVFIGRKYLKSLFLNASNIEEVQNRTFHGLKALKTLHLEENALEILHGYEFSGLDNLEELYLHQNSLTFIGNDTFSTLHSLRRLSLYGNNFVAFPMWQVIAPIEYNLIDLSLRGNEWSCECKFATDFKSWLLVNPQISDKDQVQCVDQVSSVSSATNRSQTELVVVRLLEQENHRCVSSTSQSTELSILEPTKSVDSEEDFKLADYLWMVIIPAVLIVLILLAVMSYYWRKSIRIWFHSRTGIRLGSCNDPPGERDKLFDAFVSYSSKDECWVRQVLAAELENGSDPPYRLCLRYRDLPSGGTYLADTIVQASEASRRTILVLSHHFLKGEWSRTDVKSAHHSVLKDRHRKVIIILLGDLPSKDLDPDIRLYLKNHTYLNCDDKKFWEKLRYALPDVKMKAPVFRGIHGRTSSSRNNTQHRPSAPAPSLPVSGAPLQVQNHHLHHAAAAAAAAHHHHYSHPSPNLSQAHHLTHLGPNTQNNITSPLIGPPPPLTAPPVPGLLANLPPNIPNGTIGPAGHPHHHHAALQHHGGGPVTTVIGGGIHGGSTASISTSSNNSGSQRAQQRHHSTLHPNNRQNTAIHI